MCWDHNYDLHSYRNPKYYYLYNNYDSTLLPSIIYEDYHEDVAGEDDHEDVARDDDCEDFARDDDHEGVARDDDREDVARDNDHEDVHDDDDDYNIAQRVMMRRRGSSIVIDTRAIVPISFRTDVDVSMSSASSALFQQANTFISKMLNFMLKIAPSRKYSKLRSDKRKKRKMMKYVHAELSSIWRNCEELFPRSVKLEVELNIVPRVDWSKFNSRMIKNIPSPFTYPVHGVSNDPEFYKYLF